MFFYSTETDKHNLRNFSSSIKPSGNKKDKARHSEFNSTMGNSQDNQTQKILPSSKSFSHGFGRHHEMAVDVVDSTHDKNSHLIKNSNSMTAYDSRGHGISPLNILTSSSINTTTSTNTSKNFSTNSSTHDNHTFTIPYQNLNELRSANNSVNPDASYDPNLLKSLISPNQMTLRNNKVNMSNSTYKSVNSSRNSSQQSQNSHNNNLNNNNNNQNSNFGNPLKLFKSKSTSPQKKNFLKKIGMGISRKILKISAKTKFAQETYDQTISRHQEITCYKLYETLHTKIFQKIFRFMASTF